MQWNHRFIIYVDAAHVATANQIAQNLDPDPGCGLDSFALGLSPDGYAPATQYGTNTAATDEMAAGYQAELEGLPWAGLYNAEDGSTWDWDDTQRDQLLHQVHPYYPDLDDYELLPPWVGKGTHRRICVLSPMSEVGDNQVADILEQYTPVAFYDYGGDDRLHTIVCTVTSQQVTQIENNSYYHILWSEAV